MEQRDYTDILTDKVIHERVRLLILTFVASSEEDAVLFTSIRSSLELSAGNLSVQLKTLEKAGYLKIEKKFVCNKPQTSVRITKKGTTALDKYLEGMEQLIKTMKKPNG